MTHVWWLDAHPLCDDQHIVDLIAPADRYRHSLTPPDAAEGAVVVCPARYHSAAEITELVAPLPWVVLILTSDEESKFDATAVQHPALALWVMTPRPDRDYPPGTRFLGEGFNPATRPTLARIGDQPRRTDAFLAGQNTHERRHDLFRALAHTDRPWRLDVTATPGFMQGHPRDEYLARMAQAKVAPCPSGPTTPDSFRLYEAIEAGCVPLADETAPGAYPNRGYWEMVAPGHPFETIAHWHEVEKYMAAALVGWPRKAAECQAWWVLHKQAMTRWLADDVARLSGMPTPTRDVDDLVTVILVTSPIPSHPSTEVIAETIRSIRERLPRSEILVGCDGVAAEVAHRAADYVEFLRRFVWLANHEWDHVAPHLFAEHTHQYGMTHRLLDHVRTPLVLFVEHDTPLVGDVDWTGCARAVMSGAVNLIRFHHEASVLEPHRHLMVDDVPWVVEGVPLLRTVQWSQRPHLAAAGAYRTWLDAKWWRESDGMIEDRMHGVLENDWLQHRDPRRFRLALYAPSGDMKRSTHLDGRAGDPKVTEL